MSNQYDSPRRQVRQMIVHAPSATGLSVPGTAASDTVLLRIQMVNSVTVNGSARIRMITGGTAAGPTITFGKSLAGTGAVVAFGTQAFGTDANGTTKTTALTSTDFDFGDELVISNVAGTAASTPVITFSVPYNQSIE